MTTPRLRRDAARNWQQIVDVGQRLVEQGSPLRLNDVAQQASVGVATVYRHFPTPEALLETIALPSLEKLADEADRAVEHSSQNAWEAFSGFFVAGIDAQLADAAVQPVVAAGSPVLPRTAELLARVLNAIGRLIERAHSAGAIRADVTQADVTRLLCGVVFAGSVHTDGNDRAALTRRYLNVVLAGLRATPGHQR
ncbi:TetR/AcrR family transcriptional regulator [Cryptosporangium sp. NPDC048952]|uniref:TetR/AcrR family transcriptional regulator n=1 Tax=Cryptosporangium sp. NPDC048952 TaxID=3363961 RepID=UPI003718EB25